MEVSFEQMNEAMALFVGMELKQDVNDPGFEWEWINGPNGSFWPSKTPPPYHTSWDWLMPVVVKIETMERSSFGFTIDPWDIIITEYASGNEEEIVHVTRQESKLIDCYYEAVYGFIQWYNKQKEVNNE